MKPSDLLLLADEKGAGVYELVHYKLLNEMAEDISMLKDFAKTSTIYEDGRYCFKRREWED